MDCLFYPPGHGADDVTLGRGARRGVLHGAVQEGGAVGEEDAEQGGGEAPGHQPAPRHLQPQRGRGVRHQHAVTRHREPEPEQHQAAAVTVRAQ